MNYSARVKALIGVSTLLRCLIASSILLGNDEVYYFFYGEHLQWNYFDHPPGIAVLIKLFTLNDTLHGDFFVRLGSIVCAAVNTFLVYKIGSRLKDQRTGWIAALLLTASIYASIICGVFIMPDSPQSVFWLISLYLMQEIFFHESSTARLRNYTLILGIAIGGAVLCKVHGVFLWAGAGLYILFFSRKWMTYPWLYVSVLITAIMISPILIWNIQHDFVTYRFHSERIDLRHSGLRWDAFFSEIGGEIFYNNPLVVWITATACIALAGKRDGLPGGRYGWLLCMGLPIIIVLWVLSLKNPTLPHWSGPGYLTLSLAGAAWYSQSKRVVLPILVKLALGLSGIIVTGGILLINFFPGTLGSRHPDNLGSNDFSLDMYGWKALPAVMDSMYKADLSQGKMQRDVFLLAPKWFPAAHLDYYLARPMHWPLYASGPMDDIHHYYWLNTIRNWNPEKHNAYLVIPSNFLYDAREKYAGHYREIDTAMIYHQYRSSALVRKFYILRLYEFRP